MKVSQVSTCTNRIVYVYDWVHSIYFHYFDLNNIWSKNLMLEGDHSFLNREKFPNIEQWFVGRG